MLKRLVAVLRSIAAIIGGYLVVAGGTILTFNVLVGQVTINSNPVQLVLGTIGAVIAGLAGGMVAGLIAPAFPVMHAAGVLILIAIDTAAVLAKGPGPIWFDLAGSTILAIAVLIGGWIVARRERIVAVRSAV